MWVRNFQQENKWTNKAIILLCWLTVLNSNLRAWITGFFFWILSQNFLLYLQLFFYMTPCSSLTDVSILLRDNVMNFYPCFMHICTLSPDFFLYTSLVYLSFKIPLIIPLFFQTLQIHQASSLQIVYKSDHIYITFHIKLYFFLF